MSYSYNRKFPFKTLNLCVARHDIRVSFHNQVVILDSARQLSFDKSSHHCYIYTIIDDEGSHNNSIAEVAM